MNLLSAAMLMLLFSLPSDSQSVTTPVSCTAAGCCAEWQYWNGTTSTTAAWTTVTPHVQNSTNSSTTVTLCVQNATTVCSSSASQNTTVSGSTTPAVNSTSTGAHSSGLCLNCTATIANCRRCTRERITIMCTQCFDGFENTTQGSNSSCSVLPSSTPSEASTPGQPSWVVPVASGVGGGGGALVVIIVVIVVVVICRRRRRQKTTPPMLPEVGRCSRLPISDETKKEASKTKRKGIPSERYTGDPSKSKIQRVDSANYDGIMLRPNAGRVNNSGVTSILPPEDDVYGNQGEIGQHHGNIHADDIYGNDSEARKGDEVYGNQAEIERSRPAYDYGHTGRTTNQVYVQHNNPGYNPADAQDNGTVYGNAGEASQVNSTANGRTRPNQQPSNMSDVNEDCSEPIYANTPGVVNSAMMSSYDEENEIYKNQPRQATEARSRNRADHQPDTSTQRGTVYVNVNNGASLS